MSDPHDDPIDRDLAEGFTHLRPPEELVSNLLNAAQTTPPAPTWGRISHVQTAIFLVAILLVLVLTALGRPADESTPPEPDAAAPLTIPPGMRAVTVTIPADLVSERDATNGAIADLLLLESERTVTVLRGALVLAGGSDSLTFACAPEEAEKLVLSRDLGPVVPSFHVGQGQRHVTVPVDSTPIDAGLVEDGMHTDLLATTHDDGAMKTTTFLTDVPIDQVHLDGRVTVRVSPKQAELLLHMVERGPISLSLRGR